MEEKLISDYQRLCYIQDAALMRYNLSKNEDEKKQIKKNLLELSLEKCQIRKELKLRNIVPVLSIILAVLLIAGFALYSPAPVADINPINESYQTTKTGTYYKYEAGNGKTFKVKAASLKDARKSCRTWLKAQKNG